MPETPKPDLSEHEEEVVPIDNVLRRLLEAKPRTKKVSKPRNDADKNDVANREQ